MISDAYKLIMWGILISGCHWEIGGTVQIIPMFVGYAIVWYGIKKLCAEGYAEYYDKILKDGRMVCIVAAVLWIVCLFLGYTFILSQALWVCFYLLEVYLYGNLLNKNVKLLKENSKIKAADNFRKNRMRFIKLYFGIIGLCCLQMLGQALKIKGTVFLGYAILTFMLFAKIWMSMFMQNMSNYELNAQVTKVDNER